MTPLQRFTTALAAFFIIGFLSTAEAARRPLAAGGVLDLSSWDLSRNSVPLDGEWTFRWKEFSPPSAAPSLDKQRFISVPSSWTSAGYSGDGYATYCLTVITPHTGVLGIRMPSAASAYELLVNGSRVLSCGSVSSGKKGHAPEFRPQEGYFVCSGKPVEITLHISNFSHCKGGLWESITFGTPGQLQQARERSTALEMFLIGALLVMTFYHAGLFFFRRQNRYTVYFALICLLMAVRTGYTGERLFAGFLPFIPWEIQGKLEYISAYLCVPLFLLFLGSLFREENGVRHISVTLKALAAAGIAICLPVAALPMRYGTLTLLPFSAYFAAAAVFAVYMMSRAVSRKRDGSMIMLAGLIVFAGTVVNDILYNSQLVGTGNYASAGLFIFVLTNANIISLRFSRAFDKVEVLTGQLTENNTQLKNLNTQLEHKNREITQRLFIDKLTGLPNRQSLFIDISSLPDPILLLIDIDAFKEINDFYGNKIGDYVLKEVAVMIQSLLNPETQSIYKLSVDEYAILIRQVMDERTISQFTHYICREIGKNPIRHGTNEIFTRVTIGVAKGSSGAGARPLEETIVRADMALKRAKRFGKPFLIYDESMQIIKEYEKNMMWARKVKNALESGRIVPYFQPIIHNGTGKISKFECLVRLIDEEGTVISPFHFLDVARKSRLYPELTKTIVRRSFEFFADTDYEFSINISIDDILDEDTRVFIFDAMNSDPETGSRIVFELLESQGIESYSEVTDFITVIKAMGAKIAVDDFGSGYSNFEHILKLNIDYIKIDASLVKNIHTDRNSQAIVKTIAVFAKELGLETVAEFVHCQEVLDKIRELGLTYSQGFYLGEPKPGLPESGES